MLFDRILSSIFRASYCWLEAFVPGSRYRMRAWNSELDRRSFLHLAGASLGAAALGSATESLSLDKSEAGQSTDEVHSVLRIEPDAHRAQIAFLSWDTE